MDGRGFGSHSGYVGVFVDLAMPFWDTPVKPRGATAEKGGGTIVHHREHAKQSTGGGVTGTGVDGAAGAGGGRRGFVGVDGRGLGVGVDGRDLGVGVDG